MIIFLSEVLPYFVSCFLVITLKGIYVQFMSYYAIFSLG